MRVPNVISRLSKLFVLALIICPSWMQAQDAETAEKEAIRIIEDFAEFSRFFDEEGNPYDEEFQKLFQLNARLPLDFIIGRESEFVTPAKYWTEFEQLIAAKRLQVKTTLLEQFLTVTELPNGTGHSVMVPVERMFSQSAKGDALVELSSPKKIRQNVEVMVTKTGRASIVGVAIAQEHSSSAIALRLYGMGSLSNIDVLAANTSLNTSDAYLSPDLSAIGVQVEYHFNPFDPLAPLGTDKLRLRAGLGFERWTYSMSASAGIRATKSSHLGDQLSGLALLADGNSTDLNDPGLQEDFVLGLLGSFNEEELRFTSLSTAIGFDYAVFSKSKGTVLVGMSLGLILGTSADISVMPSITSQDIRWSEGQSFEGHPLEILDQGGVMTIKWRGGERELSAEEREQLLESYQFMANSEPQEYRTEVGGTAYLDFRVAYQAEMSPLLGFEVYGFLRPTFSSPISNESESADIESLYQGLPRLVSIGDETAPFFGGAGIALTYNRPR